MAQAAGFVYDWVVAHGAQPNITFDGSAYVHRIDYRLDRYLNLRQLPRVVEKVKN